ncbi:calcium-binding protein [Bauldia litoralis]|uniref:Hemolysin-type calcium-binding repeat-containing protein n=1 Tax=Bauldia litoralis TaxID=665467 RepID=A0A1G6EEV1_9HYPH|nr:calcium-binding protein [Bauldia litoralis]SDB55989.1 Hemolysin-type calcium-binding repeat-containing protein [Bauldia litoralis]
MTTYTYEADDDDYVSDAGVHVSTEAMDAINSFSKAASDYVVVTGSSGYSYTVEDYGIATMGADDASYDNAFVYSAPGTYGRFQHYYSLVIGNDGDNVIKGNSGDSWFSDRATTVFAGQGDDKVYGYSGNDTFYGEDGNDLLSGGDGNDALFGGAGDDFLYGGKGTDTLVGGDGNDWLFSGQLYDGASDTLTGGAGADTFVLGDATDEFVASADVNWAVLAVAGLGVGTDIALASNFDGMAGSVAKKMVPMVSNALKAAFAYGDLTDTATPEAAYATVTDFNPLEDVLILPVSAGDRGNVFVSLDTNIDSAFVIKYDDGTSVDIVATINFADAAAIYGDGFGSLSATAQQAFVNSLMQSALVISADGAVMGMDGGIALDVDTSELGDLGTTQFIVIGAYSGWYLQGDSGSDYLFGTNYDDVIAGYNLDGGSGTYVAPENAGNDELRGFGGDDVFLGGQGNDYIDGGDGSDTSSYVHSIAGITVDLSATVTDANGTYAQAQDGFGTTDKLFSIENITGSDYDDVITGDTGANTLAGGAGDDTIDGGAGDDTIYGGAGHDSLDGGEGFDTLSFADAEAGVTVDLSANQVAEDGFGFSDDVFNFEALTGSAFDDGLTGDAQDNAIYGGAGNDIIDAVGGNNTVDGGDGNDRITAGSGNDTLSGGAGDDLLSGGAGDDVLYGGDGNDTLVGGEGDDVLYGGSGNDTLTGGAGADTFVFDSGFAGTVTDFDPTEDTIMIDGSAYGIGDLAGDSLGFLDLEPWQPGADDGDYTVTLTEWGSDKPILSFSADYQFDATNAKDVMAYYDSILIY